ncbi:glycosyltransferase family 4 protein [Flavihumibacter petaseus]|uniref:glycosyltransferase family 4 protein n=1 Tax=Flavihumibacter petaseus TaxID=549295 RepID=UPI00061D04EE|nr:glycosyltransferase family 4 protein [Flavihumibacter petaseus]
MNKCLHIVSHDVPYPLDYGGVIDIFCTLQSLHAAGVEIILHCFEYGRGEQPILNQFCREVFYYRRQEGHKGFSFQLPYIVSSRSNPELLDRLAADDHPILLEGIHCSYLLQDKRFDNRNITLRLFNVEHCYYKHLYRHERSLMKKAFYFNESRLLEKYEAMVASRVKILTLSDRDTRYYREVLGGKFVKTLPVFVPHQDLKPAEGLGSFCLYHGNLGVAENEKAAEWLLEEVFVKMKLPFVVAGKNPSSRLERIAHQGCHTCLIADPEERELKDLISKAQINILPSFNETGVKLKLLNALFNGRHCVVNDAAIEGTPLGPLCHIAETPAAIQRVVMQLYHMPFGEEEIRLRRKILEAHFNNSVTAGNLLDVIRS